VLLSRLAFLVSAEAKKTREKKKNNRHKERSRSPRSSIIKRPTHTQASSEQSWAEGGKLLGNPLHIGSNTAESCLSRTLPILATRFRQADRLNINARKSDCRNNNNHDVGIGHIAHNIITVRTGYFIPATNATQRRNKPISSKDKVRRSVINQSTTASFAVTALPPIHHFLLCLSSFFFHFFVILFYFIFSHYERVTVR